MTERRLEFTSLTDFAEVNDLKFKETWRARREQRRKSEAIYWGGVLLWAGLVFAAEALGVLPQIGESDVWSWVFFGAGLYGLLLLVASLVLTNNSRPTAWDTIWSGGLLAIGLGGMTPADIFWPFVLIVAGLVIFGQVLFGRE